MTVEVRMMENSKKKLARGTWAGHLGKIGDEKLAENSRLESGGEMEV